MNKALYLLLMISCLLASCSQSLNSDQGTFKDRRDGQSYQWLKLKDGQRWMIENLNFAAKGSLCYDNADANCSTHGRMYRWAQAKSACPQGWHLPADNEYWAMFETYGKSYNALPGQVDNKLSMAGKGTYLKLEALGFTKQLGGYNQNNDSFQSLNNQGFYWTTDEANPNKGLAYYITKQYRTVMRHQEKKETYYSCRCVAD